jgi:uncharacterized spore protein YtfJ
MFENGTNIQTEEGASLPERLAEAFKTFADAKMIYGDPIERDGVTIIPFAKLRYGFGGGRGRHDRDEGGGGGGGMIVQPAGYIELKEGSSRFLAIREPATFVPLVMAGGLTGLLMARGLYKMLRR